MFIVFFPTQGASNKYAQMIRKREGTRRILLGGVDKFNAKCGVIAFPHSNGKIQ